MTARVSPPPRRKVYCRWAKALALLALLPAPSAAQHYYVGEEPFRPELGTTLYWVGRAQCEAYRPEARIECWERAHRMASQVRRAREARVSPPAPARPAQPASLLDRELAAMTLLDALRYRAGEAGGWLSPSEVAEIAGKRGMLDVERQALLAVYARAGMVEVGADGGVMLLPMAEER